MIPVRQEDGLGCAVACVAFVLQIPYAKALDLFTDGKRRVREEANFYCPELVKILNDNGLNYKWKKIQNEQDFMDLSIVFFETSPTLPYGHFLVKFDSKWMDPWINLPENPSKAGFRDSLPGKATYIISL